MAHEPPVTMMKDDRLSLFCSISCRDKWLYLRALQTGLEAEIDAFDPKVFTCEREPVVS